MRTFLCLLIVGCSASPGAPSPDFRPADEDSFVVLELFTSQGCSSCPPADRELNQISDVHPRVFPIAWHIDYWNGLGWPDPWSDPRYSERQRAYDRVLDSHTYTPQLVVQGQEEFPGARGARIADALARWIAQPGTVSVSASAHLDGAVVRVEVLAVTGAPAGADLQLVLVERGLVVDVPRGENAGDTLRHDNVVRSWVTIDDTATSAELPLPSDVVTKHASVIVLVQDPKTLAITGATALAL